MCRIWGGVAVWASLLLSGFAVAGDEPGDIFDAVVVPVAPSHPPTDEAEIRQAERFLTALPHSDAAPRVVFDLLVSATVERDQKSIDRWRTRLLLEYPASVYSRYLLSTVDAATCRTLLQTAGYEAAVSRGFSKQFLASCKEVMRVHRAELTTSASDELFLLIGLAARVAGDDAALNIARSQLLGKPVARGQPSKVRQAAEVLFDETADDAGRVLRLHAIPASKAAQKLETHFADRLSPAQQQRADVRQTRIERLLEAKKFADALNEVEALMQRDGPTAQRLFWAGWCQTATGRDDAAATLALVAQQFPQDEWAEPAAQLAAAVAGLPQNLDAAAALSAAAIRQTAAGPPEWIESRLTVQRPGERPVEVYAFVDLRDRAYELCIQRGPQWLGAVRSGNGTASTLLPNDAAIHRFAETMPIPEQMLQVSVKLDPQQRTYNFSVGDGVAKLMAEGGTSPAETLTLLQHLPAAAVRPFLQEWIEKGEVPTAIAKDGAGRRSTWLTFNARRPEVQHSFLSIDDTGRLVHLETPTMMLHDIQFGKAGDFAPTPPEWPDRPTILHEKFDVAVLFSLFSALSQLWTGSGSSPLATGATP